MLGDMDDLDEEEEQQFTAKEYARMQSHISYRITSIQKGFTSILELNNALFTVDVYDRGYDA